MKKQIDGQISLFDYIAPDESGQEPGPVNGSGNKVYDSPEQKRERSGKLSQTEQQQTASAESPIRLYRQCANCWCSDCKHNEKLDAVPRDFAGVKKACPACAFCLKKNRAEICEIGSYDNGCKLRAVEEGIEP